MQLHSFKMAIKPRYSHPQVMVNSPLMGNAIEIKLSVNRYYLFMIASPFDRSLSISTGQGKTQHWRTGRTQNWVRLCDGKREVYSLVSFKMGRRTCEAVHYQENKHLLGSHGNRVMRMCNYLLQAIQVYLWCLHGIYFTQLLLSLLSSNSFL